MVTEGGRGLAHCQQNWPLGAVRQTAAVAAAAVVVVAREEMLHQYNAQLAAFVTRLLQ